MSERGQGGLDGLSPTGLIRRWHPKNWRPKGWRYRRIRVKRANGEAAAALRSPIAASGPGTAVAGRLPARTIARQTARMLYRAPFIRRGKPHKVYGAIGSLEVRLARTKADVRLAQRLRYQVFYEEMSAVPSAQTELSRRDDDRYDRLCDHLLVIDNDPRPRQCTGPGGAALTSSAPTGCCVRRSPSATTASTRKANTTSRR